MLTEPLNMQIDYLPVPPQGGIGWLTNTQISPPQHKLLGGNQSLQGPTDLRSILLQRLRDSFAGA